MAKNDHIGEFEELVLLAIINQSPHAYGVSITEALEQATNRKITVGALYATLDRLEQKGFIRSWLDEPTAERGGRAKKFFDIEASGENALREVEHSRRILVPKLMPAVD